MGTTALRRRTWAGRAVPVADLLAAAGLVGALMFTTAATVGYLDARSAATTTDSTTSEQPLEPLRILGDTIFTWSAPSGGERIGGEPPLLVEVEPPPVEPPAAPVVEAPIVEAPIVEAPLVEPVPAAAPAPAAPESVAPAPVQPAVVLPELVIGDPGSRPVEVGVEALESLPYPWERLGYTVRFLDGRAGLLGMTYPYEKRIDIHVRSSMGVAEVREILAHEIGHAVDAEWMTGQEQYDYRLARGLPGDTPWYGCSSCTDFDTLAGDYAETFAMYVTGSDHFASTVAPKPTKGELEELERFFAPYW